MHTNTASPSHARPPTPRRRRPLLVAVALAALIAVALVVTVVVVNTSRGAVQSDPGAVRTTEELVESLGVAVQLQYSAERYESDLRPALADLGIRHIRVGGTGPEFFDKVLDLHASFGIRSTAVMDPRDGYSGRTVPEQGVLPILPALEAVEGPNEWDINEDLDYQGQTWPEGVQAFQEQMYSAMKDFTSADAAQQQAVRDLTVLTPTVAFPENAGDLGEVPCDASAIHSYPGGNNLPDNDLDDRWLPQGELLCPGKPVWSTESGYCNELTEEGCTNQGGVSERASAKYALRHYMEYFARGVQRDYLYNLATDEWDLFLREDGDRKPAFAAVQSFIDLLEEPGAEPFTPDDLDVVVDSPSQDVRQQVLQRSDGSYVLALWLNVRSYDAGEECCDIETEAPVTVTLPRNFDASVHLPTFEGTTVVDTIEDTATLELSVPDHVMLVTLT